MKIGLISDTHYGFDEKSHGIHEEFWKKLAEETKESPLDLLIHAGDWATADFQFEIEESLKIIRKYFPNLKILTTWGNHDYWSRKVKSLMEIEMIQKDICNKYNVHSLEDQGMFQIGNVKFVGFNGWYGNSLNPPTKDMLFMPSQINGCPTHLYLSQQAYKALDKVLETEVKEDEKLVVVSHFPTFVDLQQYESLAANFAFHEHIISKADYFCVGHSHQKVDRIEGKCRILNCGTNYNKLVLKTFEIK